MVHAIAPVPVRLASLPIQSTRAHERKHMCKKFKSMTRNEKHQDLAELRSSKTM